MDMDWYVVAFLDGTSIGSVLKGKSKYTSILGDESSNKDPRFIHEVEACLRPHPIRHHNEELVALLRVLYIDRKLKYSEDFGHSLSYAKAIATIISYPKKINSQKEAKDLPNIGDKITSKIGEFITQGKIVEVDSIIIRPDFITQAEFLKIFGVGAKTAQSWYLQGHRCIGDLKKNTNTLSPKPTRSQRLGIEYFTDFSQPLSRKDNEEIADIVKQVCKDIEGVNGRKIHVKIVGGYARGKDTTSDCDIIISRENDEDAMGLLKSVVDKLKLKGLMKADLLQGGQGSKSAFDGSRAYKKRKTDGGDDDEDDDDKPEDERTTDRLPKVLSAFLQPSTNIHRQLDLVASPWSCLTLAIIGWTGSTIYERSLRHFLEKERGFKFNSDHLTNIKTNQDLHITSEEEFFRITRLPYWPPELRNA